MTTMIKVERRGNMAVKVLYKKGTKATFLGLAKRDANALYFCTDSRELYKGNDLYSDGLRIVSTYAELPPVAEAADGKLYFCADTGNGYVLNDARAGWTPVFYGFDGDTLGLNENGLLSVKAVPLASVTGLVGELERIEKLSASGGVKFGPEFQKDGSDAIELKAVAIKKVEGLEDRLSAIEKLEPTGIKPIAKANLNASEFEIDNTETLNIVKVSSAKVDHHGEVLEDVIDRLSAGLTWEDIV